jgi:hypothetical protein
MAPKAARQSQKMGMREQDCDDGYRAPPIQGGNIPGSRSHTQLGYMTTVRRTRLILDSAGSDKFISFLCP